MISRRNIFLFWFSLGIGSVLCFLLAIILLFDGRRAYAWMERVFITQPSQASTAVVPFPSRVAVTPSPSVTATQTSTPTQTPTPTPAAYCGGPPSLMLVLVGTDSRTDSYYAGLADSIRLVRVDFVEPGVMVLPFQRDLYVEIPGLMEHGITHGKLNQGYTYGTPAFNYYDAPNRGLGLMEETLEQNFGVHVDNGIAINLQSFTRIVDALGGIDIYLPYTIDGRVRNSRDSNLYFKAGNHHLNGYRTQMLARLRPNGDIQRTDVQNLILQALADKLLSPKVLRDLPKLIDIYKESVFTDLTPVQMAQLMCLAPRLDSQKIEYVHFPQDLFKGSRVQDPVLGNTFVWDVDFDVLREYTEAFGKGGWPETQ